MIDFNHVPKVALDFMNHDHEEATELVNRLETLINQTEAGTNHNEAISAALAALYQHNSEHFGREEQQMRQVNFPPYPVHKGEHERVLAEMVFEIDAWNQLHDLARLKTYITEVLPAWFINHIATMDTMTAIFIAQSK